MPHHPTAPALPGYSHSIVATALIALMSAAAPASAADAAVQARAFQVPAGPLADALLAFSVQSGLSITAPSELLKGLQTRGVQGSMSTADALARLLHETGMEAVASAPNVFVLRKRPEAARPVATMAEVSVVAQGPAAPGDLPTPFAGGQVATASRMGILGNVGLFDTPFSTQSYTEQFASDQQARRVADIIAVDASVRSAQAEYGDTETYIVRGFPLFVNQVGINGLYGMTEARRITPEFYERIDVLKGPAAMLNGMTPFGVVGGNVNLASKRAADEPLTRLTASHVSESQFGGHLDAGRRFGQDRQWGVRVNLLARDGATPISRQEDRMRNGALALDYRSEKLDASIDLASQDRRTRGQSGNITYGQGFALPRPLDSRQRYVNDWEFIDAQARYWTARVEYRPAPALAAYANFGRSKGDEEYFYAASQIRRLVNGAGDFTARVGGFRGAYEVETWEAGLRGRFALAGVSSRYAVSYSDFERTATGATVHATGVYTGNLYTPPALARPTLAYGAIPQNGDLRLSSLGIVNTLGLLDERLLLTVGLRDQKLHSGVFANGVQTRTHDAGNVTPTAALLFKMARYSLYANYSEGLAQGAMAPGGTANQGEILAPSVTEQAEAGIKYDGGTFGLTAAVFRIAQPSTFTNPRGVFVADGEQRNRGLELTVFGQPAAGVRLLGGVTLIDAEQTRTQNGSNDGKDAVGVPKRNLVLNGEYDVAGLRGLTVTGRLNAFSSARADVGNTQAIPGWATVDLGARYLASVAGRSVTLRANLMNVADRNYWNSVSRGFLTMGAPRTLLLSAAVEF